MKLPAIATTLPAPEPKPAVAPVRPAVMASVCGASAHADTEVLRQLADKLSATIGMTGQQVQFSVDDDTGTTVLRVTDAESGALLRQIPGDEALAMARILDQMKGVLIRQKA